MKKKILIIDDFTPLLNEVSEFLTIEGYQVFSASNGLEGIEKAVENEPDLILCDILMPKCTGYQVYEEIMKMKNLANVPFVFITAKATPEDFRKGLKLGAVDYISKPFGGEELLLRIKKHLIIKSNEAELEELKKDLKNIKEDLMKITKKII